MEGYISQLKLAPKQILPASMSGKPIWSDWSASNAINNGLKASAWVYVCIMRNANAIAQLPWVVETLSGDTWVPVTPLHPLQRLMNRPNDVWSRQSLMTRIAMELMLAGNSVLCKIRVDGRVVELYTLRPQDIAPVPTQDMHILGYQVKDVNGRIIEAEDPELPDEVSIGAEDTVHLMLVDPSTPYWGLSPMQAAAKTIDVDVDAAEWQKVSLQNMMVPPGFFQFKGHFTDDQWTELQADLADKYKGSLNAREPMALGDQEEVKWTQLSLTPQEVDFLETRKLTREEICAIYGVPPPVAGILERATYSNIETARDIWWQDTLIPFTQLMEDAFNLQLVPEFGDPATLRVRADMSGVVALQVQTANRIVSVKDLWSMGVPFNTASDFIGLGLQIPGGDVGYLPGNLLSTGSPIDSVLDEDEVVEVPELEVVA
jgi:HK97 family phage portal protein